VRRAESGSRERRQLLLDRRVHRVQAGNRGAPRRSVGAAEPDRRAVDKGAPSIPRVLLVDDRPEDLASLERTLAPLGAKLAKARGPEEALLHLLRERFAAILVAVHLPRLEGLRTAELIHEREETRSVPIVFISGLCREAAYAFKGYGGSVDYLLQPVDPEILVAKVRALCELWVRGEKLRMQAAQREQQDVFVASLAHAMRKELAAAKAQVQLALSELEEGAEDLRSAGAIRRVSGQLVRVAGLVSDLLHVSGISGGGLAPKPVEVDLAAIAREVAHRMQVLAERHRFTVRAPAPAPALVDRDRIEQALTNLVGTAIRYAPAGGPVEIGVQILGDWVQLTVQGSGLGIAHDPQQRMLDRSRRGGAGDSGGIGLAITRAIVERHGGKVWAEPGRGRAEGSTFFVQIPRRRTR
jgi:two-component system sensor histidine kinase/response regulator